jgi:hypothetical protein
VNRPATGHHSAPGAEAARSRQAESPQRVVQPLERVRTRRPAARPSAQHNSSSAWRASCGSMALSPYPAGLRTVHEIGPGASRAAPAAAIQTEPPGALSWRLPERAAPLTRGQFLLESTAVFLRKYRLCRGMRLATWQPFRSIPGWQDREEPSSARSREDRPKVEFQLGTKDDYCTVSCPGGTLRATRLAIVLRTGPQVPGGYDPPGAPGWTLTVTYKQRGRANCAAHFLLPHTR